MASNVNPFERIIKKNIFNIIGEFLKDRNKLL